MTTIQFDADQRLFGNRLQQQWFHEFPVEPGGLGKMCVMPTEGQGDHLSKIKWFDVHPLLREFLCQHKFPFEEI